MFESVVSKSAAERERVQRTQERGGDGYGKKQIVFSRRDFPARFPDRKRITGNATENGGNGKIKKVGGTVNSCRPVASCI